MDANDDSGSNSEPEAEAAPPLPGAGTRPHVAGAGSIALAIGALGVVYGDIGTSPLYAMNEVFFGHTDLPASPAHALGAASLVLWSLLAVVTFKYVGLILRADNNGEGGMFALLGLLVRRREGDDRGGPSRPPAWLLTAVLAGAALLFGDGLITPAISVLSAVEGLAVIRPEASPAIIPITVAILAVLFWVQKRGTHTIGRVFGPVMVAWFLVISALGIVQVVRVPEVLAAVNPLFALDLLREQGLRSVYILGSVVLCVTGVEAMYADMGHFGRRTIVRAWTWLVLPCLVLNYFGQAAFILSGAEVAANNLFYALAPSWGLIPLTLLATLATVIASQALISGTFSLTQQAMALGVFPRLKVVHTNPDMPGQIYIPFINFLLFAGSVALVLAFGSSSRLASAYGMAVTGTMLLTTLAFAAVARWVWGWRWRCLAPILAVILTVDCAYFGSNLVKIVDGGFVPVVIGAAIFAVMDTWRWGRQWIGQVYRQRRMHGDYGMTVQQLVENETRTTESGASRSVVVMASRPISQPEDDVPPVLAVHIRNWRQVPKHVILLSVVQTGTPYARDEDRYRTITFSRDTYGTVVAVHAFYGYMEQPNVREALAHLKATHQVKVPFEPSRWLILIGAERFVSKGRCVFERLRISLFSRMNRLAKPVTDHFGLASDAGVTIETINI